MNDTDAWSKGILDQFTAGISPLWIACDPDGLLLDEGLLSALRHQGFAVMVYDDDNPFAFRAEYEERYRARWDRDEKTPPLLVHWRGDDAHALPWDIVQCAIKNNAVVSLSLAELFPNLVYSVVQEVAPEHFAPLFAAHQDELQSARGERESRDFILEWVYQLTPKSFRSLSDFWREVLRMHLAGRALPPPFAQHAAAVIAKKGWLKHQPVALWLSSKSALLQVVQEAWEGYLKSQGFCGTRINEPSPVYDAQNSAVEIPFAHSDVQTLVDSMFLNGSLHPLAVSHVPADLPSWMRVGIVQDPNALQDLLAQGLENLRGDVPDAEASYKDWGHFAQHYGEILARSYRLPEVSHQNECEIKALQEDADAHLKAWIDAGHYADLTLLSAAKAPVMVHHVPHFLQHRRKAGEDKLALLVFDGLAWDQWVQIREHLMKTKRFAFDEATAFAWLPTITSVSRQAIFSGLKPREFAGSIDHTNKEESLWKTFWQNKDINPNAVLYQRALRHVGQLDALAKRLDEECPSTLGLVVDEVDERVHKESTKKDVAVNLNSWLQTGFVERLFFLLLERGFHLYLTADHGNVQATGSGTLNQGVVAKTRGERVRVYNSAALRADAKAAYPEALTVEVGGLPEDYLPLFAGKRGAFVDKDEQLVSHGGLSIEELIVPFIKVSEVSGS